VAVHGEAVGDILDLGELAWLVGEVTTKVLLKEGNDLKSILMVLDGLDEKLVGVASLVFELFRAAGDLNESVLGPVGPLDVFSDLALD